jgi:hypothetical protein
MSDEDEEKNGTHKLKSNTLVGRRGYLRFNAKYLT